MTNFILRRLAQIPLALFAVAILTFFLARVAPGGPFDGARQLPVEVERRLLQTCHLDAPVYEQFVDFLRSWLSFKADGCTSMSLQMPGRSVWEIISEAFPLSLQLGLYSLGVALLLGLTAGIVAALRQNTWMDHVAMSTAIVGVSVPNFILGPLLILVFSLTLGWVPPARWDSAASWILPSLTLGLAYSAYISRLTRAGLLEVVRQDFMRTARAKGLPVRIILFRHGLRAGLLPVISYLGPAISSLFTGSMVVEQIFSIPGLGRTFVTAALNRDYNVVLGAILIYASFLMVMNLIVDVLYGLLDPRVRIES
ncbi:MAG: ABC transporter permease [Deltaproteobacteria bacterium]|nr:ABC transporter permease [Deltaproteobacteria bacterium]